MILNTRPTLTLEAAQIMMDGACQKAKDLGITINVAITDQGANLLAFARMDDAPLLSSEIAQNKAYTAASFGLPTHEWYPMIQSEPALLHGIVHTNRLVVFGGGIPVVHENHLIGGIGVSGGSAEQDVTCAEAGVHALYSKLNKTTIL
ncbi:GlcG/HbpS family heme-binding protein [Brevibacillus daliensis]|uniref:GlcG/HbpS family heme-binding protein n=1 Tax=Brevibacillus daliensis TaxID=2892995 RepID=UPI001E636C0C|nr:heme-binding protein [Brevibacillus daliensis]